MKILFVNACVRDEKSRTLRLAKEVIERKVEGAVSENKAEKAISDDKVEMAVSGGIDGNVQIGISKNEGTDLDNESIEISEVNLDVLYNAGVLKVQDKEELELRENLIGKGSFDDEMFDLAKEFMSADDIVIAAPYWDLQFPALLKIYLERISVSGLTFTYNEQGFPMGQCKAKKATYVTTAGGFTTGMNYGYEYIKGLFTKLFTFDDVELVLAEGLDIIGNDPEKILQDVIESL